MVLAESRELTARHTHTIGNADGFSRPIEQTWMRCFPDNDGNSRRKSSGVQSQPLCRASQAGVRILDDKARLQPGNLAGEAGEFD